MQVDVENPLNFLIGVVRQDCNFAKLVSRGSHSSQLRPVKCLLFYFLHSAKDRTCLAIVPWQLAVLIKSRLPVMVQNFVCFSWGFKSSELQEQLKSRGSKLGTLSHLCHDLQVCFGQWWGCKHQRDCILSKQVVFESQDGLRLFSVQSILTGFWSFSNNVLYIDAYYFFFFPVSHNYIPL